MFDELDDNRTNFLYYLEFYKSIYELPEEERPKDYIIKNDLLCDEWLRVYISKKKQAIRRQRTGNREREYFKF